MKLLRFYPALLLFPLFFLELHAQMPRISVHAGGHYLQTSDGRPFFWLGDTGWELFHRLTRNEVRWYLDTRQRQGFNIIQAVALAEFDGLREPNAYGDLPFKNMDPLVPDITAGTDTTDENAYDYWDHIDFVLTEAAKRNLYVGFLPTWGDKVVPLGMGPVVFNETNAFGYAYWLGARYKNLTHLVWILGGDRAAIYKDVDYRPVWRAMARGLHESHGDLPFLVTYHPPGGRLRTTTWLAEESWLDVHGIQSGHGSGRDVDVWNMINEDWNHQPPKPVLDLEPNYEDHPVNPWPKWEPANGYFRDHDVRKQVYRSVFAGGCGVTYGHHFIWQFYDTHRKAVNNAEELMPWPRAAVRPGAEQVQYLKRLLLSRAPYFTRVPDQSLLASPAGEGGRHVRATREKNGKYAMVYLPAGGDVTVNLALLSGTQVQAWWYNPRNGEALSIGTFKKTGTRRFAAPAEGPDWVLVLDDAAQKYFPPGRNP